MRFGSIEYESPTTEECEANERRLVKALLRRGRDLRRGVNHIAADHMFVVHSDGSECPDGCDSHGDPNALLMLERWYDRQEEKGLHF